MDSKTIKQRLSIKTVLEHYGLMAGVTESQGRLRGRCNVHGGDCRSAFSADLEAGLWHCFSRNHGGSVVDLIAEIEHVNPRDAAAIAGRLLGELPFFREQPCTYEHQPRPHKEMQHLSFQLKLDPNHPYLDSRGIAPETRTRFGLGYCSAGVFTGRLCIPIHDSKGVLVGYTGRSIDDSEPKYLLPRGFPKSSLLYDHHRVAVDKGARRVIVVEGYFDVFRLFQAGYSAVALMGSSLSEKQAALLLSLPQYPVVMLDGDQAGRKGTQQVAAALRGKRAFSVINLPENTQPDTLSEEELRRFLR